MIGLILVFNVSLKIKKIMKKTFFVMSAAFVLFALASCQKEADKAIVETPETVVEQAGNIPFELVANLAETKTTLNTDTWAVSWEDPDLIYAVVTDVSNDPAWGSGDKDSDAGANNVVEFSYADSKFSTTTGISDGEHTFNFIYSGNSQKKYHRSAGTTNQLSKNQTFNASAPTANIKAYDAMVGQTTVTTPASLATVTMNHLYTLMKVTLHNSTGSAKTVTQFDFTAKGADIAGVFTVDFATPAVTISSGGSEKISVAVSNGAIAADDDLDIYFVMAPLSDFVGRITMKVTDANSVTYTRFMNVTAPGISFAAGSHNSATFTMTPSVSKEYSRITSLSDLADDEEYVILGLKTATSYGIFTYGAPDGSSRIAYTQSYTSIPPVISTSDVDKMWKLGVSGEGASRNVTIYNETRDEYLKASGALSWDGSSGTSFTATVTENLFAFKAGSNYLGVNKSANYWRDYASGTLTQTNEIILYKYWTPSTLSSIALSGTYPTSFYVGQSFSYDGLIVIATYENGKSRVVVPTSVSDPDLSVAGTGKTVTVTYEENAVSKTATYNVDVIASTQLDMSEITVSSKTHNAINYSWAAVANATGYKVSTDGGNTYSDTQVETTYSWTGLSASTSYTIYVKAIGNGAEYLDSDPATKTESTNAAVSLASIAVTTVPTKTFFKVDGTFSFAGAVVTATYSDASTADVTASCTTNGSTLLSTTGTKDVTVSYTEGGINKTTTYEIKVVNYTTLTNANIVAAGAAASGYASYVLTDGNSNTYNAYAIKNQHSKTTSAYHFLQIKAKDVGTYYYIQIPTLGTKIYGINMTVSSSSKPKDGGSNTATLFFSNSNETTASGTGVASGTGASSVSIDTSSLTLNTGYITAGGAVRIWDIEVLYL